MRFTFINRFPQTSLIWRIHTHTHTKTERQEYILTHTLIEYNSHFTVLKTLHQITCHCLPNWFKWHRVSSRKVSSCHSLLMSSLLTAYMFESSMLCQWTLEIKQLILKACWDTTRIKTIRYSFFFSFSSLLLRFFFKWNWICRSMTSLLDAMHT